MSDQQLGSAHVADAGFVPWAARVMAASPGAVERALAIHTPTDDGLCANCSQEDAIWWPCTVVRIAELAQRAAVHPTPSPRQAS
ncbi:hypothetical protein GCM10023321_34640 [Pseudonocardia eucalypti]|uniref:Uncharacterized protein n=1 Tax=Pseudonocardia eucalypti TaxID=648755 RepID=A0ABP9Q861_9PSEU|nr:hypothetical protein [Pseudonocardia eucalypti]